MKRRVSRELRTCKARSCGARFQPQSNSQKFCKDCRPAEKLGGKKYSGESGAYYISKEQKAALDAVQPDGLIAIMREIEKIQASL